MGKAWAIAALSLLVSVAGCSDAGSLGGPANVVPQSIEDVQVTSTTGAIRGVVIDDTIKPVAGVLISVTGLAEPQTTADDGGFVFNGLEPRDYFLSAAKAGFQTIQSSTSVQAGVDDPPIVRIMLLRLLNSTLAYANLQVWEGFTQCGVSATVVFAQACGVVDGRFINYFSIDSNPTFMQAEMFWKSSQAVTPKLQLNFYKSGTTDWKAVAGISPLLLKATGEEFTDAKGEDADDNPMRVSPPYAQCTGGLTSPTTCDPQTFVIVNVNQAYTIYLTQFYGFTPRESWLFEVDGPCETVEDCGA